MKVLAQRLRFGRNVPAEVAYIKVARKKLAQLKARVAPAGIKTMFDTYIAPDGTIIIYGFLFGEEQIRIIAPPVAEVVEEEKEEKEVLLCGFIFVPVLE